MIPRVEIVVGSAAALFTTIVFSLLSFFPNRWTFFIFTTAWVALFFLFIHRISRRHPRRGDVRMLALFTTLASIIFFSLVEWRPLKIFAVAFSALSAFLLTRLSMEYGESAAVHEVKAFRRLHMAILTIDAGIFLAGIYAIAIFFPLTPFWLLLIFGGVLFGMTTFFVWRLYFAISFHSHLVWLGIFALAMAEIMWVLHRLPFGYFASAILTTWLWYVGQLLMRFHLTPQGIFWRQQGWFLGVNSLAYLSIFFFFLRWV